MKKWLFVLATLFFVVGCRQPELPNAYYGLGDTFQFAEREFTLGTELVWSQIDGETVFEVPFTVINPTQELMPLNVYFGVVNPNGNSDSLLKSVFEDSVYNYYGYLPANDTFQSTAAIRYVGDGEYRLELSNFDDGYVVVKIHVTK